jgi:hypothetical protein
MHKHLLSRLFPIVKPTHGSGGTADQSNEAFADDSAIVGGLRERRLGSGQRRLDAFARLLCAFGVAFVRLGSGPMLLT